MPRPAEVHADPVPAPDVERQVAEAVAEAKKLLVAAERQAETLRRASHAEAEHIVGTARKEAQEIVDAAREERLRLVSDLRRERAAIEETRTRLSGFLTGVLEEVEGGASPATERPANVRDIGEATGRPRGTSRP